MKYKSDRLFSQVQSENNNRYLNSTLKWIFIFTIAVIAIGGLILGAISLSDFNSSQISSLNLIPDPPPSKYVNYERIDEHHQVLQPNVKKIESASGLLLKNDGKSYSIANTGVYSIDPGKGILVDDVNINIPKISIDPNYVANCNCSNQSIVENVTLSSSGGNVTLVENGAGPHLGIKGLVDGNGIILAEDSTTVTITSTLITRTYNISYEDINNLVSPMIIENYVNYEILIGFNIETLACVDFDGGSGALLIGPSPNGGAVNPFSIFVNSNLQSLHYLTQDYPFQFGEPFFNTPQYYVFTPITPLVIENSNAPSMDTYTAGILIIDIITQRYK